jgi:site-specific recombinase XerC
MRRVIQRANDRLGSGWTLHDLRRTAARRMIADPAVSLTDVQWVLGHAHLSTTAIYIQPDEDEVVARVLEHHHTRAQPPATPPVGAYRPEVLQALLGGVGHGH